MYTISRQGAVDVITGAIPLNVDMCDHMLQLVEDCLGKGQPRIIFDMHNVAYIDSAGLESLLDARDHCSAVGGAYKLCSLNQLCRDIVAATGLSEEFEIYDDLVQGVGSFSL